MVFSLTYPSKTDKEEFIDHFNLESWTRLTAEEKSMHQLKNCERCKRKPHQRVHIKLRPNSQSHHRPVETFFSDILSSKMNKNNCSKFITDKIEPVFQQRYGSSYLSTVQQRSIDENTAHVAKKTIAAVGASIAKSTNTAVLAHNVSYRTMTNFRRELTLQSKPLNKTPYKVKHESFIFDRDVVEKHLREQVKSGETASIVWSELARTNPVTQQNGKPALNGPQILKSFAVELGIIQLSTTQRKRRSLREIEVDGVKLSFSKLFPTDSQLKAITRECVLRGEIDIGFPIVPIKLRYRTIGANGNTSTHDIEMFGRAFSLQKLLNSSLTDQEKAGALRKPYPNDSNLDEALNDLKSKGN